MAWTLSDDRPIYLQLIERLKLGIVSGDYPPGSRMPSVRELAADAAVNPNTMQRAFSELEREGLVYAQRTSGRFITEDQQMLEGMKRGLAEEAIAQFLENMARLGYGREETMRMLERQTGKEGL